MGFYALRVLLPMEQRPRHRSAREAPIYRVTYLLLGRERQASIRGFDEGDARRIYEGR
jgi:hypothetical protein